MKKQRKNEKDNRGVAIYARKSRITNKGDSIGVQFKQCTDYAKKELGLDEEYEFLQYEDKGLSGYFSDRPDFQRMLHDVQDGKIKAIVCYKLDRVGRKTADLIRLMDFLEMYHVNLLICSNGINTASGLYKIFIQIFAVIAEFERDTLTERIVDNMMELAKDGRWLGGNTPMGFTVRRVTTGSGKGKSAYSYLESLTEEKCMVQRLYEIFRTTRSIQTTAKQMNEEGFHTPSGAAFNASTTRLVLRNPIYCTADKRSYDYFIDHDGNVFGDMTEFDGTHGLSAYNKTDQEKYEGSDSTFISPKYVQTIESKPVSEWIIAVGKHEGFIPSEQWIEVQELLDAIAEKYNRPHRKTNALLAGLAHCPHCGRRLSVIPESDRWTNGKPRFKYVCPGYRKKECNFKAVDGVLLDEFVVQQLSELSDENSERFRSILEIKIEEVLEQSQTVQEHNLIKKKRDKLKADIVAQTRNLREADGSIKQFIQEDLQNLAEELRETERQLSKLDEGRKNNMIAIRDLEMTKERLLSFAEYAKDAQPEVLVTLIQTIVERIYIVDKDDERYCHIFIKGCSGEDYTGFFQTAGYIEHNSAPVCDSEQYCIYKHTYSVLHGLIFRPCFYLYLHKTMKIFINFSANLHRVLLTFLRHKFNIKNDRKFSEAVKNNEKQKRTFKRKILDPRMGARNRRANLLEHGKPVVQHLCLRKNRKRSDNNLLDGWRFRNGNDHIHLPLRLYLRQNRQAENNGVCRLYPLGHIHHCFRADAVSCSRQQRHTVRAHGNRRCGRRGGRDNELLRLDGK